MIALDASTTAQPFRDGVYDIKELGEKLQALIEGAGYISFKYADGSVVSLPAISYVQSKILDFARLTLGGSVILGIYSKALAIRSAQGDGALEASISEHAADEATVSGSHIYSLIVSRSLFIQDFSDWAASNGLAGKRVSVKRVSGTAGAKALAVSTRSAHVTGAANLGGATFRGEWASSPISSAAGLIKPNVVGFYDGSASGAAEIALDSSSMLLNVPSREASSVTATIRCELPYCTPAGWEYLEAGSYTVDRGDTPHTEAARGAMPEFLLWPCWQMGGGSASERTFRVYPGGAMVGEAPIVRVKNTTNGTLTVPHVWQFGKNGEGKGTIAVLSYIKLPPYSCKEFEFRHDSVANCGYMYPLSAW